MWAFSNFKKNILVNDLAVKQIRDFAIVVSVLFIFIAFYFSIYILLVPAPVIFLIGMFKPTLLKLPAIAWFTISNILGYFSGKIILTVIFLVFVIPFGFIRKLTGYDSLKNRQTKKTTFTDRNHIFSSIDFKKPF
ncbi:MAG: hypothetical protein HKN92_05680 [Chitinophagales bacterium]|nr:hypothetical protein [Chitinophagales bacterium]